MCNPWQTMISRQFTAALQMLRQTIEICPNALWDDRSDGSPFWHLAYHTLFYTDFYLSKDDTTFQAREYHIDKANFLPGDYKEFGGIVTTPEKAFSKEQLLDYADHCLQKCEQVLGRVTDEQTLQRCGFWWYELNIGEFLLNNLRHVQHHTGQLTFMLRRRGGIGIEWMGTKNNQPAPPTWS